MRKIILAFGILGFAAGIFLAVFAWRLSPASLSNDPTLSEAEKRLEFFSNELIAGERANDLKRVEPIPAEKISDDLCGNNWNFECYDNYYSGLTKKKGVSAAMADLRSRYDADKYIKSQCHPLVHVIGRAMAEKNPEVGQAFAEGDSFCWSGYYHGVMEGIASKIGREHLAAKLNQICAGLAEKRKYDFDHYNCVHGLGHGVMAITNTELFEALEYCAQLTDSWERSSCAGGVFMENVIIDGKNHVTKYLKPSEPLYPCNAVLDTFKTSCYLMQTSYMLKVLNRDFSKVFEMCGQADAAYVDLCYQSLGRDASGQTVSSVPLTKNLCLLGKDFRQQSNCVIGAVKDFISYFHSNKEAYALCASLPEDLSSVCRTTADEYYKLF